jgi:hypothetical protein
LFSFPRATEMFHFARFPTPALCVQAGTTGHDPSQVSPFGHPWIGARLPAPQGLSQAPTSFFGSGCQGIHRVHLFACRNQINQGSGDVELNVYKDARARYGVLKGHREPSPPAFPFEYDRWFRYVERDLEL